MKQNIKKIEEALKSQKCVALLAPSFVVDFEHTSIISSLKKLGFDKVMELTFGAKMVNKEYKEVLKENKMFISTACSGITCFVEKNYPELKENLIRVDSPMIASAKIAKQSFPKHKTIFISPCNFKKEEAETCKEIDFVIDFQQLKELFSKNRIDANRKLKRSQKFDGLYNDYTKIYPIAGGLSKTAKLGGILKDDEIIIIDGISEVKQYLDNYIKNPDKKARFLDINFCIGGCLGGPFVGRSKTIDQKNENIKEYLNYSKKVSIGKKNMGTFQKAKKIKFKKESFN